MKLATDQPAIDPSADALRSIDRFLNPAATEPLYRFEAQLDFNPIGLVAEGIRMANSFEGRVTGGLPELAFLKRAIARIDGRASFSTGALEITPRIVSPLDD